MEPLQTVELNCPYCGEPFETTVDASAGEQHYVEDCQICCSPIVFHIGLAPGDDRIKIELERENA